MTELTPELLRTFVAKIIVYEKEVKYSKHAPQKIHICFRDFNLNETDDMLHNVGFQFHGKYFCIAMTGLSSSAKRI